MSKKVIAMTPPVTEERGKVKLSIMEQDPRDIVGRCLTLERLRTIPVELIEKLSPRYDKFLIGKTSKTLNKNGKPVSKARINFEYALFDATQRDILDLFDNFVKVRKGTAGQNE